MALLKAMADEMRSRLKDVQKGWLQRHLFGGLSIVLERREQQWRLALGRTTALPSTVEERVAEEAFGVPAGTQWERGLKRVRKKQQWLVTECRWLEVADGQQSETEQGVHPEAAGTDRSGPDDGAGGTTHG